MPALALNTGVAGSHGGLLHPACATLELKALLNLKGQPDAPLKDQAMTRSLTRGRYKLLSTARLTRCY